MPGYIVFPVTTGGELFVVVREGCRSSRRELGGKGVAALRWGCFAGATERGTRMCCDLQAEAPLRGSPAAETFAERPGTRSSRRSEGDVHGSMADVQRNECSPEGSRSR